MGRLRCRRTWHWGGRGTGEDVSLGRMWHWGGRVTWEDATPLLRCPSAGALSKLPLCNILHSVLHCPAETMEQIKWRGSQDRKTVLIFVVKSHVDFLKHTQQGRAKTFASDSSQCLLLSAQHFISAASKRLKVHKTPESGSGNISVCCKLISLSDAC